MSMNAADLPIEQIGPSEATLETAVKEGYVDESFLATPPTTPGTGTGGKTVTRTFYTGSGADRVKVTVYSDGSVDEEDAPESFVVPGEDAETAARRTDARNVLSTYLARYGLGSLTQFTYELIARDEINTSNPDALIAKIRERPEYIARFPANEARLKAGLSELDPASYIALEEQYLATLRSNALPENFYDNPTDDFRKFIEGDVSPAELQARIENGYNAVKDADPAVKNQMRALYGVSEGELAAYFIDPERTRPLLQAKQLQRQAQAANIAARGLEQGNIQLTTALAEELASRGITEAQALAGFGQIGALGELTQTFAGEQALTTEDYIGAAFGYDVQAQQDIERRRRGRVAEFQGGGRFATTQGETQGTTQIAIGEAQ